QRRLLQPRDVIRRRHARESTRRNKTIAIPYARVAWGAVDVEALAAALQDFFGDWERHDVAGIVANPSGIEICVFMQLAAGDCSFHQRTSGTLVGVEVAGRERVLLGLHVHVQATAGPEGDGGNERERGYRSVELR